MRILHFSDIHLNDYNYNELKDFYLDALINKLLALSNDKKIDVVAITGDLIDKGGFSLKEILRKDGLKSPYQIFEKEFINPIANKLRINKCNFLFIPGNHDIQENEINWLDEKNIFSYIRENINDQPNLNKVLADDSFEKEKRIKLFKDFEQNYHLNNLDYKFSIFQSVFTKKIEGVDVGFILINDSWRCKSLKFSGECKKLFFGESQLTMGLRQLDSYNTKFNICLMHHNLKDYLEQELIERTLRVKDISIVLNGHYHKLDFQSLSKSNPDFHVFRVGAGLHKHFEKDRDFKPSFQVIDLNLKFGIIKDLKYYVYDYLNARFDDISNDLNINGILPKPIPNYKSIKNTTDFDIKEFTDYE